MKGQILGFDGASGAISGEDGVRYSFSSNDWKGPQTPRPRENVDFVATGTQATDIYPVKASILSGAAGGGSGAGFDLGGQDAKTFVAERPQLLLSVLAIIVSLFIPMVGVAYLSWTAVNYPGMLGMATDFGGGNAGLSILHVVSFALWLIPAGAAYAIFLEFTKARNPKVELGVGVLCLGAVVLHLIAFSMAPNSGVSLFSTLAIGAYLLIAIGIGLIMTSTGKLARVPGM